jgi:hypothetical protein
MLESVGIARTWNQLEDGELQGCCWNPSLPLLTGVRGVVSVFSNRGGYFFDLSHQRIKSGESPTQLHDGFGQGAAPAVLG